MSTLCVFCWFIHVRVTYYAGIGNGLIITPKFVAISQWFDTQRGRAISLATMVDGCGVFVMTPVLYVLQYYYSYHVSWVVLAGFMMQCMVGGALLRKPFAWECQASGNVPEQENIEEEESLYEFEKAVRSRMHSAASDTCENTITSTADSVLTPKMHLLNPSMLNDYAGSMDDIFVGFKRRISQSCNALAACEDKNALYKRRRTVSMEEFTLATVCGIEEEPFDTKHTDYYDQSDYNSDCEWTGYDPCDSDMRDTPANGRHTIKKTKLIREKMLHYLDYRLLVDSKYLSFTLLAVMFVLGSSMRNTHFAGLCKEKHLSEMDIMILITTLGGITTALKFLSGSLFDFPQVRIHRKHIFFMMSLLFGTMLAVAPQMTSLPSIYIVWIIFISASTIMTTQESVILADLVSHESLPSAIGINRFARSIGVLIGPTVGGRIPTYFTQIARLMGPTWGPPGDDRTQVGPMMAPWTLLSGNILFYICTHVIFVYFRKVVLICLGEWFIDHFSSKQLNWHWDNHIYVTAYVQTYDYPSEITRAYIGNMTRTNKAKTQQELCVSLQWRVIMGTMVSNH